MIDSLVEKAKNSKYTWWKWALGLLIGLLVVFVIWKIKRQANKIVKLEAEIALAGEKLKDLKTQRKVEENEAVKEALFAAIVFQKASIATRKKELAEMRKLNQDAQKAVDRAKDWKELEKQAKGDSDE